MMDNNYIIELFFENFTFLKSKGFSLIEVYENSEYQVGIVLKNPLSKMRVSFAYYNSILTGSNKTPQNAIYFTIFNKENKHLDLSRLLKDEFFFKNNCYYQYILLNGSNNFKLTLFNIKTILIEKYDVLLNGNDWIDISYNAKDDY